jgi:hypothetical protein
MSFDVFLECVGEAAVTGISRPAVRALFPVVEVGSEFDYWRVQYDETNYCHIGVNALPSDKGRLKSFFVERPCGDLRLWQALASVLRMGTVIFWPGGPPVLAAGVSFH